MCGGAEAAVGSLYIELHRAKSRLAKRRHDAQQIVETLRMLADCFDESETGHCITEASGRQFRCTKTEMNSRAGKCPFVDFPTDASEIATDIYELESEVERLEERLDLEMKCL